MTRRLLSIVGIFALVAVACGDSDDGDTSSSSTSTGSGGSASSTTSSTTPEATTSTHRTFITERSCHEGSSEATFDDAGGVYATLLTDIDPAAPSLSFDVVQWLVGEDADDAWHEEYPDDPDGPPNGYFIKNENPTVRTAPVADDVVVRLVRLDEDADADLDPGTFAELPDYLAGQPDQNGSIAHTPYWLAFEGGEITGICEQFTP